MTTHLSVSCQALLDLQHGVIARWQAAQVALDHEAIDTELRHHRWQSIYRGVYAAFTGQPSRHAVLWAGVLRAGPGAMLSPHTAAELDRLTDRPSSSIHVMVGGCQQIRVTGRERSGVAPSVVVHRSAWAAEARHPSRTPPRTRIEETTLDLTQAARSVEDASSWVATACGRRLTTPRLLEVAIAQRARFRWRRELVSALADIADGVHSALESRYVRCVERPHGLPRATRQAAIKLGGGTRYLDNLYRECGVAVELDGQVAHPVEARWRDIRRDNGGAAAGIITLRYSWTDIAAEPCRVAAEIAAVLKTRGWEGHARSCGPNCPAPFS